MAKDVVRFTVYLPRNLVLAARMAALNRGVSASRFIQECLLKDRILRKEIPKPVENGKERRAS